LRNRQHFTRLAEDKVQKRPVEAPNRHEKQEKIRKAASLQENDSEKTLEQSQPAAERDQTKHKIDPAARLCLESTNPINKVFVTLIYLQNSTLKYSC